MSARSRQRAGEVVRYSRAAILRVLDGIALGGWEDEQGRPVSPEVARDAALVLRRAWTREGASEEETHGPTD